MQFVAPSHEVRALHTHLQKSSKAQSWSSCVSECINASMQISWRLSWKLYRNIDWHPQIAYHGKTLHALSSKMFVCMWLTNCWQSYGPWMFNERVDLSCGELYHKKDKACVRETAWVDTSDDSGPTTHLGNFTKHHKCSMQCNMKSATTWRPSYWPSPSYTIMCTLVGYIWHAVCSTITCSKAALRTHLRKSSPAQCWSSCVS